jgi:hypothetical protein
MPLPKPRPEEDRENFLERCMSNDVMVTEFENGDQRFAICNAIYGEREEVSSGHMDDEQMRQITRLLREMLDE